jgi:hypothetical protein
MKEELSKKATVEVENERKIIIEIPEGVKAGKIKIKDSISIVELFRALASDQTISDRMQANGDQPTQLSKEVV